MLKLGYKLKNLDTVALNLIILPIIVVIVLIVITISFNQFYSQQKHSIEVGVYPNLVYTREISDLYNKVNQNHARIINLLRQAAGQELDEEQVYELGKELIANLYLHEEQMLRILADFKKNKQLLGRVEPFLNIHKSYRELISSAITMATVELELANQFIQKSNDHFIQLGTLYLTILSASEASSYEKLTETIRNAEKVGKQVNILSFFFITGLLATLIILNRRVYKEIRMREQSQEKQLQMAKELIEANADRTAALDSANALAKDLELRLLELTESEQRISTMLVAAPNGILLVNSDDIIQQVNPALLTMFGYQESDLLSQPLKKLLSNKIHEPYDQHRQKYVDNPQIIRLGIDQDFMARHKDGSEFYIEIALSPLTINNQDHIMAEVINIDQRKKLELSNQQKNLKLQETAARLIESNSSLERFAYICSHDLQEPVRTINSFSKLLKSKLEEGGNRLDPVLEKYLNFITDSSAHAKAQIVDVLAFSTLDNDTERFEFVDLNEYCRDLSTSIGGSLEEKNGKFIWNIDANANELLVIPGQFRQLLLNLVNNGLKFNTTESPTVWLNLVNTDELHILSVSDNGIGIEAHQREACFEVFKRLQHRSQFPGTGLGLSICKKIAINHRGEIYIEDSPYGGTTFVFRWPKTQDDIHTVEY